MEEFFLCLSYPPFYVKFCDKIAKLITNLRYCCNCLGKDPITFAIGAMLQELSLCQCSRQKDMNHFVLTLLSPSTSYFLTKSLQRVIYTDYNEKTNEYNTELEKLEAE